MSSLSTLCKSAALSVFVATGAFVFLSPLSLAQAPADQHVQPPANDAAIANNDLAAQLQSLRKKVADLEAMLQTSHQPQDSINAPDPSDAMPNKSTNDSTDSLSNTGKMQGMQMGDKKMEMMKGMGGMGQRSDGQSMPPGGMGKRMMGSEMGGMKGMSGGSGGMGMMSDRGGMPGGMGMGGQGMGMMKGMGMMGRNPATKSSMSGMESMGSMNMPSALPGFAGASHLYHIGETGFFLDHPQHIALSDVQQLQLNKIKEASLLATATAERKIDEAEQELWTLTAEAQPDITKIEAKAHEIAQLQVGNRIAFIRSVGNAAEVLTKEQRQTLIGMVAPEPEDSVTTE